MSQIFSPFANTNVIILGLIILGLVIGFLSGLFGVGGGFLFGALDTKKFPAAQIRYFFSIIAYFSALIVAAKLLATLGIILTGTDLVDWLSQNGL